MATSHFRLTAISTLLALALATATPAFAHAQSVIAATPPAAPTATTNADAVAVTDSLAGARDGEALANKGYGWFGRSFVVGSLTSLYGVIVIVPISVATTPTVPLREREKIMTRPVAYQRAFERRYTSRAREKRILTTIGGSLLGMFTIGYLVLATGPG